MKVKVHEIAAFTSGGLGGNPAGVVLHADALTKEQKQLIARRVGFAETAFVNHVGSKYMLDFFDPSLEVELCGHATIATWSLLKLANNLSDGEYTQYTEAGPINISLDGPIVYMEQLVLSQGESVPVDILASALGVNESNIGMRVPNKIISTGLETLLVEINDLETLHSLKPDRKSLMQLAKRYGFVLVHPFVLLGHEQKIATVRNFGPGLGVFEDIATGTSNGALFAYLLEQRVINPGNDTYLIDQGKDLGNDSTILVRYVNNRLWVGGETRTLKVHTIEI